MAAKLPPNPAPPTVPTAPSPLGAIDDIARRDAERRASADAETARQAEANRVYDETLRSQGRGTPPAAPTSPQLSPPAPPTPPTRIYSDPNDPYAQEAERKANEERIAQEKAKEKPARPKFDEPIFDAIYDMLIDPASDLLKGPGMIGGQNAAEFSKGLIDQIGKRPVDPRSDPDWDKFSADPANGVAVYNKLEAYRQNLELWGQASVALLTAQMNAGSSRFATALSFINQGLERRYTSIENDLTRVAQAKESDAERAARALEGDKNRLADADRYTAETIRLKDLAKLGNDHALEQLKKGNELRLLSIDREQGYISARADLDRAVAQGNLAEISRANKRGEELAKSRLDLDAKIAENDFILALIANGGLSLQTLAQATGQNPADVLRERGAAVAPGATGTTPLSFSGTPTTGQLASMTPQQRAALAAQSGGPDELVRRSQNITPLEAQMPERGRV